MMDVKIRAARTSDEAALLQLAKAEMDAHAQRDERFRPRDDAASRYAVYLRDRTRDIDSMVFVAEVGVEIVGLAIGTVRKQESFFRANRFGYVSDLMVKSEVRRRGVGRALYERIVLWFRSLGIDVVRLHVASNSHEARAFWDSLGAREFLVESWIDLEKLPVESPPEPAAPPEAGPESDLPGEPETAKTPGRSGFDYPDDSLPGGGGLT